MNTLTFLCNYKIFVRQWKLYQLNNICTFDFNIAFIFYLRFIVNDIESLSLEKKILQIHHWLLIEENDYKTIIFMLANCFAKRIHKEFKYLKCAVICNNKAPVLKQGKNFLNLCRSLYIGALDIQIFLCPSFKWLAYGSQINTKFQRNAKICGSTISHSFRHWHCPVNLHVHIAI